MMNENIENVQNNHVSLFKSLKLRRILSNILIYIILIVVSLIWIAPIVWLVLQSFGDGISTRSKLIPNTFTFDNYLYLFVPDPSASVTEFEGYYIKWIVNTFIVAIFCMFVSTFMVLATAYALSRFRFNGRSLLMKLNLVLGMFPGFLSMIIMYWVMKEIFHLQGSFWSLCIIYTAGAGMGFFVPKGFFDTISKSIDEAAMIDGASRAQVFWHITLPLSKPIVVYTLLTSFMAPWGDYITSSYIIGLQNRDNWTIAIGLYQMLSNNEYSTYYYTQFAAGSVIIAIPITLLFMFMQKYYVGGVTGGAVKG